MNNLIPPRRINNETLGLGTEFALYLYDMSINQLDFTIGQFITALKATTTWTTLEVELCGLVPTPENKHRFVEPLVLCLANLRRHNPNHPLRKLEISGSRKDSCDDVDQLLIAAKQFGIHTLILNTSAGGEGVYLRIQSLVKVCRNNNHLKVLDSYHTCLVDEESTISVLPQDAGTQDPSAITALDELKMCAITFDKSSVESKFRSLIEHVTYRALDSDFHFYMDFYENACDDDDDDFSDDEKKKKKIARMRILSELLKPSVEELRLDSDCRREVKAVIEACPTVTQIQVTDVRRGYFSRADVQQKLQRIASRNRKLARSWPTLVPTLPTSC